jgi:cysteinylglycine-S-conjugate dipeptidase
MSSARGDVEALTRIPSVGGESANREALRAAAIATAKILDQAGAREVELIDYGAQGPAVLARSPGPKSSRRVLLYAHYDVQPAGERGEWTSDPFEPVEREGRLFGRGVCDDKAGIAIHAAALRALATEDVNLDVTVLIEGEEEIDSPNLGALLERLELERLNDVIVADGINWQTGTPGIYTSLRGSVNCLVEVAVLERAVHSGHYGGPVPDALVALSHVLASLHDENGRVAIDGLAGQGGDVAEISVDDWRREAGVLGGVDIRNDTELSNLLWNEPALSVLAIDAPSVSEYSHELVPRARALISLRVPPSLQATQAAERLVEHLERHVPWGAQLAIDVEAAVDGYALKREQLLMSQAIAALSEAWEAAPMLIGEGASLPLVPALLARAPDLAIAITGVGDPSSNPHGPDESLDLADLERACAAESSLLCRLGNSSPG